jgi:hypothetical protein
MNNSSATTTQMADLENILFTKTPLMLTHLSHFLKGGFYRNKQVVRRTDLFNAYTTL